MRTRSSVLILFLSISLSGCDVGVKGVPTTEFPSSISTESARVPDSSVPHSGAPKIDRPLSASILEKAVSDTCKTLTESEVRGLGLDYPGNPKPAPSGPSCDWSNLSKGSSVSVTFPQKIVYEGLSQAYEKRKSFESDGYFIEISPIEGFPAIEADSIDARDRGSCVLQVGLTDQEVMSVGVTVSQAKIGKLESCSAGRRVAGMILANIKGL